MVELETSRRSDCHGDAAVGPDLASAAEHYRPPSKGPPRTIRSAPSTVSVRTMTSSPRPRPAGCRSVGNAVTRVARSRRLHLVEAVAQTNVVVDFLGTPLDLGVNLAPPERHDVRACRPLAGDHCHTAEPKPGSSGPNLLQPCGSPTLLANRCCRLTRGARLRYPHATALASARRTCATSEDTVRYYELPMSRAFLNVRAPQSPPNDEESHFL